MLQMPYFDSTSEEDDALCSTPSSSQPSISYLAPPRPINMVRSHSTSSLHDLVHDLRRKQMQVHKNDNSNKYSNNGGLASQLLKKVKRISIVFQPHHHHHHHHQEKQKQPSSPPTSNTTTTAEIRRADSTVLLAHTTPPPIQPLSAVIEETDQLQLAADRQDRWVQNGIRLHEKGQFEKATHEFRRAASEGSPMGMLFYGMSLRHGWGCRRDERLGFKYLQRSAELNLLDLEHEQQFSSSKDSLIQKVKSRELRVAIYELGVSLSYGWGCAKDKRMAVYLFEMAAYLGDPDALIDAAQCYHYGYGVAKNLRLAAKYYRMAEKQGRGIVGNSWIYKSKYT